MINFTSGRMHKMIEMSQITRPGTNSIDSYEFLQVYICGSSSKNQNSGREEHNPPHFHLVHKEGHHIFNMTVSIETLEILEVYANKSKDIFVKMYNNTYDWETSGLKPLLKELKKWLNKTNKLGISNLNSIKLQWDDNNPKLTQVL